MQTDPSATNRASAPMTPSNVRLLRRRTGLPSERVCRAASRGQMGSVDYEGRGLLVGSEHGDVEGRSCSGGAPRTPRLPRTLPTGRRAAEEDVAEEGRAP